MRNARIERKTSETSIAVEVNLDGAGAYAVSTGIGFLDHMIEQFSRHSLIDISCKIDGDLHVDQHHTTEDSAIAIGQAILQALGDKAGIGRYGMAYSPMDEALCRVASRRTTSSYAATMPHCAVTVPAADPAMPQPSPGMIVYWATKPMAIGCSSIGTLAATTTAGVGPNGTCRSGGSAGRWTDCRTRRPRSGSAAPYRRHFPSRNWCAWLPRA